MQDLQERVITCPECLADNFFVASYQSPDAAISCSRCGALAGTWADTRIAHAPFKFGSNAERTARNGLPAASVMPASLGE